MLLTYVLNKYFCKQFYLFNKYLFLLINQCLQRLQTDCKHCKQQPGLTAINKEEHMAKKTPMEQVAEIREKQASVSSKTAETENARVSEQDALLNAEAMINRTVEDARRVLMLHQLTQAGHAPINCCGLDQLTPFALAVFSNEKGVRAFIESEIRENYINAGVTAIPAKDRGALLEKHRKELYELEVHEEQVIREAEAAGIDIERRPDCRPEIVLGVPAGERLPWDFTSNRLDRIIGAADAAKALFDIRQDAWLESRTVLTKEEGRLASMEKGHEPEPGIRHQRQTVEFARKSHDRAKALREEAHTSLQAKLAVADNLSRWVEANRANRPTPYTGEEFQAHQPRQQYVEGPAKQFAGGYEFGKTRTLG
jgi:hypothetical protein